MGNKSTKADLVVIGAGPGGYAAAFLAADLGLAVTLVDLEATPGGVCLHRGCIPSKTLLHAARLIEDGKHAKAWGINFKAPAIDVRVLRSKTAQVVEQLTQGLGQLCRQRNIEYSKGRARFIHSNAVTIVGPSNQGSTLEFEHAIIATGSFPVTLGAFEMGGARVMDSTLALQLKTVPKRLLVIGGGYIGLELGSVYGALGSEVTVVEMLPGLLWGVDGDLARVLTRKLKSRFAAVYVNTKVVAAEKSRGGVQCRFANTDGETMEQTFDRVIVAVGRRPRSGDLGLENTAVEIDDSGCIKTDAQKRTAAPHIFAVGDVTGQPMLAHKASHEGRVAAEIIAGKEAVFEPRAIPAVVFTNPEIAWCGLTESEAQAQKRPFEVARFPWAASGRALTQGVTDGLTKIIVDPLSQRVLGMGIVGAGAGELIAEGVLAIEMAALASDLKMTIHPHPTLSETVMEAAEVFYGQSTHLYRPKRMR